MAVSKGKALHCCGCWIVKRQRPTPTIAREITVDLGDGRTAYAIGVDEALTGTSAHEGRMVHAFHATLGHVVLACTVDAHVGLVEAVGRRAGGSKRAGLTDDPVAEMRDVEGNNPFNGQIQRLVVVNPRRISVRFGVHGRLRGVGRGDVHGDGDAFPKGGTVGRQGQHLRLGGERTSSETKAMFTSNSSLETFSGANNDAPPQCSS